MTDINIEPNITVFHVGRDIAPEGYLWIFPKGHRSANVGIGISGTQSKDGQRAKDYLDKYVSECFPEGKIIEQIAGGVSVCEPLECTVADGLMIVGDAARISDPMTGGGIYNAMYTGRLAAEVASRCIEAGDLSKEALMEYDSVWRDSKMGRALERNYQMKEIFVKLTDKQLNAILTSVKNLKMADFSTLSLVKEIVKLNPKLIKDLTGLKKYFE